MKKQQKSQLLFSHSVWLSHRDIKGHTILTERAFRIFTKTGRGGGESTNIQYCNLQSTTIYKHTSNEFWTLEKVIMALMWITQKWILKTFKCLLPKLKKNCLTWKEFVCYGYHFRIPLSHFLFFTLRKKKTQKRNIKSFFWEFNGSFISF